MANFIDETLVTLELLGIQDCQIGEMTSGGLSFEQLKRLSVAVELVANPSIIFLVSVWCASYSVVRTQLF